MAWIDDLSTAWTREYPGLDASTLPPMVRLARLGVLIEGLQSEVVAPFEVTMGEYGVLAALRREGAPYRLSPTKLMTRLQRSSGGMTKMLKNVERLDLVERTPDPCDGRGSLVSLTKKGMRLQDQIFHRFLETTQELLEPVSKSELKNIDRALTTLLECFDERGVR